MIILVIAAVVVLLFDIFIIFEKPPASIPTREKKNRTGVMYD